MIGTHRLSMAADLPKLIEAFKAGTLGAQTGKASCQYLYPDGTRCAIGAMLDMDIISKSPNGSLRVLIDSGILLAPESGEEEIYDFELLQGSHDEACIGSFKPTQGRDELFTVFKKNIEDLAKKYNVPLDSLDNPL